MKPLPRPVEVALGLGVVLLGVLTADLVLVCGGAVFLALPVALDAEPCVEARRRKERRRRPRTWHAATDLRVVYYVEGLLEREARALADLRGDDDVRPGDSERFAEVAQAIARGPGPSPFRKPRMERSLR